MKFHAMIHGVQFKDNPPFTESKGKNEISGFAFGDPEDYKKMSKEERQKLTDKMMGKHKLVLFEKA